MISALLDLAWKARADLFDDPHDTARRLFNGFLEGCPELSIDIFGRTAVIHDYSTEQSANRVGIAQAWLIENLSWLSCILVKTRSSLTSTTKRGVLVYGFSADKKVFENGIWYALDLTMNRDTSFYMDTRNVRSWAFSHLAGKTVLNTFAYTGSLGVAALAGGAKQVVQLDRNKAFLELARKSCSLNGLRTASKDFLVQDFFPATAQFKRNGQTFDCIFLDPPFFASTSAGRVDLQTGSTRLINKVRPLINDGGWLVAINNALFISGRDYLASLETLCADGYLNIEQLIPVPPDFTGYPGTISGSAPTDPAPFNHSTKIALLRVHRKSGAPQK